jgi:hypothetical protein
MIQTRVTLDLVDFDPLVRAVAGNADSPKGIEALTAIHLVVDDGRLELVATDRYRLGVARLSGVDGKMDVLLPANELVKWVKSLTKPTRFSTNTIELVDDEYYTTMNYLVSGEQISSIQLRKVNGNYPSITNLPNPDSEIYLESNLSGIDGLDPKKLSSGAELAGILTRKGSPIVIKIPANKKPTLILVTNPISDNISYYGLVMPMRVI